MASKFTVSNRAGWLMAVDAAALIALFIILPFFVAISFSLTDQRLVSPNPTEFTGLDNYRQLLGVGILHPFKDDTRAVKLDDKGQSQFPELRKIPRNNPDSLQFTGMRELFSFDWSGGKTHALAPDVVFLRVILCTFIFVIVLALLQVGLPLLINQRLRGINVYRAIHFVPVVVSLLWSFVCDQQNGCPPPPPAASPWFQSYGIFPHMTVRENVAFGLTIAGASRAEKDERSPKPHASCR